MKIEFEVTQEHIDKGCVGDSYECPVALALKDLGYDVMSVMTGFTRIWLNNQIYRFWHPSSLQNFIATFDSCKGAKPQTFVIEGVRL